MILLRLVLVVVVHGRRPLACLALATGLMMICVWPAGWMFRLDVLGGFVAVPLCVVIHEYGHARTALLLGARELRAEWRGGSMAVSHEDLEAARNLIVALGGPAASGVIGGGLVAIGLTYEWQPLVLIGAIVAFPASTLIPPGHDGRTCWRQAHHWLADRNRQKSFTEGVLPPIQ
ncbi:M50 family metallopeptidase [Streptomyces sp. NPDC054949]